MNSKISSVTILVPIYNASEYLRECLDSILRQTYKDYTCILVNDGSTDESQSIIDEYCTLDGRFVSVSKQNEGSCGKARLFGLKYVKTEFVLMIDADDLFGDDDYVEKLIKRQRETNADIVFSHTYCFENEMRSVVWTKPNEQFDFNQVIDGKAACLLTIPSWVIGCNGNLKRKELYASLSEGNWANWDEIQGREIIIKCKRVAFSDTKYYYRANPFSITRAISPILFDMSINDAYLVKFAQKHFPYNKVLANELSRKHFSKLRQYIVDYESVKTRFSKEERNWVEMALAQSYHLTDIGLLMKRSLKWGIVVVILRRFSWFQRLVVYYSKK
jgi:glycosyltransferase involved in cell wall biosynthesis